MFAPAAGNLRELSDLQHAAAGRDGPSPQRPRETKRSDKARTPRGKSRSRTKMIKPPSRLSTARPKPPLQWAQRAAGFKPARTSRRLQSRVCHCSVSSAPRKPATPPLSCRRETQNSQDTEGVGRAGSRALLDVFVLPPAAAPAARSVPVVGRRSAASGSTKTERGTVGVRNHA